jgi:chromosome segregation ATPase
MNENWHESILLKMKERNQRESYPYIHIYKQYDQLWRKKIRLDHIREVSKHSLFVLEHESNELMNKKDIHGALENIKNKLEFVQNQLQPVEVLKDAGIPASLSRVVLENKKQLAIQADELKMAKSELQKSIDARVSLESDLERVRGEYETKIKSIQDSAAQSQNGERNIEALKQENAFLTERLKEEKDKAAKQLNEMNSFLEGILCIPVSFVSCFLLYFLILSFSLTRFTLEANVLTLIFP